MQELPAARLHLTRSMFEGLDHNLAIFAIICGVNPGRIFVDDLECPQTALAITTEGTFLVGRVGARGQGNCRPIRFVAFYLRS